MKRIAVPLVMLTLLAVPTEAWADIHFRGKSGQGRVVTLRTGDDGLVQRWAIRWTARCNNPRYSVHEGTQTTPRSPFEVHTRDRFVDVGGYRVHNSGDGLRAVFRLRTVGNRVSERRWRGIFRARVRVLRGGTLVTRCHMRTHWRVVRRD